MYFNTKGQKYNVYMPENPMELCEVIRIQDGASVRDLKDAIRDSPDFKALQNEEFDLFKCGVLPLDPRETRYDRALEWIANPPQDAQMIPERPLNEYFPDGPAPKTIDFVVVDILIVTDSILESCDVLPNLITDASRINKARQSRLIEIGSLPRPSEGVKNDKGIKESNDGIRGVHAHRPAGNYGPPTALFHRAFAKFKHRVEHLGQLELEPDEDMLETCHRLIYRACAFYDDEEDIRELALQGLIDRLMGEAGNWHVRLEDNTARPTAVWGDIARVILELKNEDGIEGNASTQAMIAYGKVIAQPKYETYVRRSSCPVILIGIMGTRLEISTAIFTDGIYVDKLVSEELYLDAWQSETISRLGRIFKAVSLAVAELREYYDAFHLDPDPAPTCAHLFPDPLPVDGSICIPKLNYLGKLSRIGELIRIVRRKETSEEDSERPYALYRAKMLRDEPQGEVDVVVKFTASYNDKAHRILAENGLAPALHFFSPLVGGMYMVVMDYIDSLPLFDMKERLPYTRILNDVDKAIQLLHKEDIVFGDLRAQNIVPKPTGGAVLIDFDWAGKHQETRYPASWNADESTFAEDVGRRRLMDKEHDIFMLKKLRKFFGAK